MKTKKILGFIIIGLIILEIILCGYIIYKESQPNKTCISGESCSEVQESTYGKVLGIEWSYIGLGAFILLLIFYYLNKMIFRIGTYIGSAVSLYLTSIQFFILKNMCVNCMEVHTIMFIILVLSFFYLKKI